MSAQPRKFFPALESLRGVAALVVIIYHVGWMSPFYEIGFIRNGALMVDIFFVLSGFVMVHCYGQRLGGSTRFWGFVSSRLWRIYPLHLLMLFVFLGIEILKYIAELNFGIISGTPAFSKSNEESFVYHLFLLHSLIQDHGSFNFPSWSISTEFYTYIVFAFTVVFLKKKNFSSIIFVIIAGLSLFKIIALGHTSLTFDYQDSIYRCLYGFFVGAFAYKVYQKISAVNELKNNQSIVLFLFFLISILLVYGLSIKHDNYIEFFIPPLAAILILLLALYPKCVVTKAFCWRPLLWLGKVSYSMYMIHMVFIWAFSAFMQTVLKTPKVTIESNDTVIMSSMLGGAFLTFFLLICVLCTSHFTYKYIENPCRKFSKLKNKRHK